MTSTAAAKTTNTKYFAAKIIALSRKLFLPAHPLISRSSCSFKVALSVLYIVNPIIQLRLTINN